MCTGAARRLALACACTAWVGAWPPAVVAQAAPDTTVRQEPAQAAAPPTTAAAGRERLTGDWGGARDTLASRGVTLQLELTGYFQGLLAGTGASNAEPGARADALVNFDFAKIGLWKGGGFRTHFESSFGDIPLFRGGALFPMHVGTALPLGERGTLVASSLYYTQAFGASTTLMVGKINAVDLLARDAFFGGWGAYRFENIAFVAPPSGLVPPVIMGSVLSVSQAPMTYTVMVYDPSDRTRDYSLDGLFAKGVNAQGGATWAGAAGGRPTSVGVTLTGSTVDGDDLSEVMIPPELRGGSKDGSWGVAVQASHLVVPSAVQKGKGLGVYGKAALSDGNPNVIRASFVGGIAAHGLIEHRPHDSFGVGLFLYDFSDELQDAVSPLVGFADEQGLEVFYSLALRRWLHVGANLQVVSPATRDASTAVVGGLRLNIVF